MTKRHKTYGGSHPEDWDYEDPADLPDVTMHRLCMSEEKYKDELLEWENSEGIIHPDCQMLFAGMGNDVTLDPSSPWPENLYDHTNGGLPLPKDGYGGDGGSWRKFSRSCHDLRWERNIIKRVCDCPDCVSDRGGARFVSAEDAQKMSNEIVKLRAMQEIEETEYPATCNECGRGCWYTEPCEHCEAQKAEEFAELTRQRDLFREALETIASLGKMNQESGWTCGEIASECLNQGDK